MERPSLASEKIDSYFKLKNRIFFFFRLVDFMANSKMHIIVVYIVSKRAESRTGEASLMCLLQSDFITKYVIKIKLGILLVTHPPPTHPTKHATEIFVVSRACSSRFIFVLL